MSCPSETRRLGYNIIAHKYEEPYLEACWKKLKIALASVLLEDIWPGKEYTITKGSRTEKLEDGSLKLSYWVDITGVEDDSG